MTGPAPAGGVGGAGLGWAGGGVEYVRAAADRPAVAIGWAGGEVAGALQALDRGDLEEVRRFLTEAAAVLDPDLVFGTAAQDI